MAILAIFMSVNLVSCSSGDDDEEVFVDTTNDYGKISKNDFVATGGYRNLKPLRATILASINTAFQGAYTSMGVEFTPNQPNFGSSETQSVKSKSGITNGHFETELAWNDEGALEPGTTYYYRAYVYVAGTRYNGETRSFETPDLQLSKGDFVDLGLNVKWASYNMGANSPEAMGTLLQQRYVFENFKNNEQFDFFLWPEESFLSYIPDEVEDANWLGKSSYDVATRTMGSSYRIPTEDEWEELEYDCRWTKGACNGVKGFYVSDKKDGTSVIFLPYVKNSSKYDITVYLSAPNDIIRNLRKAVDIRERAVYDLNQVAGRGPSERAQLLQYYYNDILEIEKSIGVGEVLTENTHIYCDGGLILRSYTDGSFELSHRAEESDFDWTHPETGKDYNFYEKKDGVLGGGVLYVRAVSNR